MSHNNEMLFELMEKEIAKMRDALRWIANRCPDAFMQELDQPRRGHVESAWDAGECARRTLAIDAMEDAA